MLVDWPILGTLPLPHLYLSFIGLLSLGSIEPITLYYIKIFKFIVYNYSLNFLNSKALYIDSYRSKYKVYKY